MMVVTIIASALIYNDYGLCLQQMKLVKRKNSVIENGKPFPKSYEYTILYGPYRLCGRYTVYFQLNLKNGQRML